MNFKKYLENKKNIIDKALDEYLPPEEKSPSIIHKAMRYSVFSGGKRIRPILALAAAELFGRDAESVLKAACGIELIHTFSLIHDDLPCIDNDDFRRGKPSNHKVFGEAIALLAGDALLVSGFDLIIKNSEVKEIKKQSILKLIKEISFYIGTENMLGGQVEDINLKNEDITKADLTNLYMKKTAALICLSIRAGAILSGANQKQLKALTKYGENIGLAFQIVDDMLDIMQDQRDMGKPNYANKYGIKESKSESERLIGEAKDSLKIFNHKAETLRSLADYILTRKR
ncbi:polyprenyl synthetase family protein [bacterium]|nr:polyprenyl synthetase family protein [bacterium]MBU2440068.1 polyprenyl synthetase family protein [bacterium]